MQNVNTNELPDSRPDAVDYATLEADVEQYIADFLESTREQFGETAAEADARIAAEKEKFRRAPWEALRWYVEHRLPSEQYNLINKLDRAAADDDFNPVSREVEIDGEIVVMGNVDYLIQTARGGDSHEARALTAAFDTALAELKEINGGSSGLLIREEAWKLAVERLGIQVMMAEPGTQVPVQ